MNAILEHGPRLRRIALLIGAIGTPVVFLRVIEDPFNLPKLALLTIVVTVVIAVRIAELLQGSSWEGLRRLRIPVAALTGPLVLSWVFGDFRAWSWFGEYTRYQGFFPYVLVIVFGLLVADAFAGRARSLAWATTIAGGVVGGYAFIQWVGADPFVWAVGGAQSRQALSTLGNPNFSSAVIGISLPVMIGLWAEERERRPTVLRVLVLAVAGLIVTFSQGGWAAGVAGAAVVLGYREAARRPWARQAGLALAAIVAVGALGAVLFSIAKPDNTLLPYTVAYRGQWWIAAADMTFDEPLFGSGPNAFALESSTFRTERDAAVNAYEFADDPHSIYLAYAANTGILGLLGFLAIAAWVVMRVPPPGASLVRVGFWAAALAYYVQAVVSIDELSVRLAFWIALAGIVCSEVAEEKVRRSQTARSKRAKRKAPRRVPIRLLPVVVLLGLGAIAVMAWPLSWLLADARVHQGLGAFNRTDPDLAMERFEAAFRVRDISEYRFQYGSKLGEAAAYQEERGGAGERYYEAMPSQFGYLEEIPHLFGYVNQARYAFAWGTEVNDDSELERSVELWRQALAIDPLNPLVRAEMAEVLSNLDRDEEALEVLDRAIEIAAIAPQPEHARVWTAVGRARLALGDEEGAGKAAEQALSLDPEHEGALEIQSALARSG